MPALPADKAARSAAIARRAADLIEGGCLILDFETTGFPSNPTTGIVEIALIDHRGTPLLHTLIHPGCHIPKGATAVHGITDADVRDAPTFRDIYPKFATLLGEQRVVAYNYTFERAMIALACQQHALTPPLVEWSCAMRAYAVYRGLRAFASLGKACAQEGITVENAHRALGDCRMTLALLYTMAAMV
ncbi:MAG: 3'-5' exonuclease [bacterium]|nr:3'-5' exonuclease [bacterium]